MDIIIKVWTGFLVFTIFVKSWGVVDVVAFGINLNDMEMLTFAGRLLRKMPALRLKVLADSEVIGHHKTVQS